MFDALYTKLLAAQTPECIAATGSACIYTRGGYELILKSLVRSRAESGSHDCTIVATRFGVVNVEIGDVGLLKELFYRAS